MTMIVANLACFWPDAVLQSKLISRYKICVKACLAHLVISNSAKQATSCVAFTCITVSREETNSQQEEKLLICRDVARQYVRTTHENIAF